VRLLCSQVLLGVHRHGWANEQDMMNEIIVSDILKSCLFPTVATASGMVARLSALQGSFIFRWAFPSDLQARIV